MINAKALVTSLLNSFSLLFFSKDLCQKFVEDIKKYVCLESGRRSFEKETKQPAGENKLPMYFLYHLGIENFEFRSFYVTSRSSQFV